MYCCMHIMWKRKKGEEKNLSWADRPYRSIYLNFYSTFITFVTKARQWIQNIFLPPPTSYVIVADCYYTCASARHFPFFLWEMLDLAESSGFQVSCRNSMQRKDQLPPAQVWSHPRKAASTGLIIWLMNWKNSFVLELGGFGPA